MDIVKFYKIQVKSTGKYIARHCCLGPQYSDEFDHYYRVCNDEYEKDPLIHGIHKDEFNYDPSELDIMEVPCSEVSECVYTHAIGDYLYNKLDSFEGFFPSNPYLRYQLKAVDLQRSKVSGDISLTVHTQEERYKTECLKLVKYIYKVLKDNNLLTDNHRIRYALTGTRDSYPLDAYSISKDGKFTRLKDSNYMYEYARRW